MAWLWLLPALLLLLACLPVGLAFQFSSVPEWHGSAQLSWAWLVHVQIPLSGSGPRAEPRGERADSAAPRSASRRFPRPSAVRAALRLLLDLARRLVAATRIEVLRLHARVGLDDPADTGVLCGSLAPLSAWLSARARGAFSFEPEFTRSCLEVDASGRVVIVPARFVLAVAGFLLVPRTWRVAYELSRP